MAAESSRLRRTLLAVVTPIAVLLVLTGTWLANRLVTAELERAASERLSLLARRGAQLVDERLAEARNDLRTFASAPGILRAARAGGARADRLGLRGLTIEQLEDRFAETRALATDPLLGAYLSNFQQGSDFAEVFFTEREGLNVAWSNPTSDFVQRDEGWWQEAIETGSAVGVPEYDESAAVVALELSVRLDDPETGAALGVAKGVFQLGRLATLLIQAGDETAVVEVVDAAGRVLVSADTTRLLRIPAEQALIRREAQITVEHIDDGTATHLVATSPANADTWWVVARQPTADAFAVAADARRILFTAGFAVILLVVGTLTVLTRWLTRGITRPVRTAAGVAGRVAAGDLTVHVRIDDETQADAAELLGAIRTMVHELRTVVSGIRSSAEELAAMAQEISASTEEMSASTQEMAATSQRLSDQAGRQAEDVRKAADDARQILEIASHLADGAREASERSAALKGSAEEHRTGLISGSEQLNALASGIAEGAEEAQTLAELSTEIQKFVTQARSVASQTNMLALNAAIEAARAGSEGRGFAVVAEEVRKLANQAARGAAATTETVSRVLDGMHRARDRFARLAGESAAVREIAESAATGLETVTAQAGENSRWAAEISTAATEARQLVEGISSRLSTIAETTETFVAAVEQIAASAEEQSASTEEIASSAGQLAEASEKLNAGVSRFRLSAGPARDRGD